MRLKILPFLLLFGIFLAGCKKDPVEPDDNSESPILTVPLIVGDNLEAGSVTVWKYGDILFVKYAAKLGFSFKETHLHVWKPDGYLWKDYFVNFPFVENTDNPDIKKFSIKETLSSKIAVIYEIPLEGDLKSGILSIAAHAMVASGFNVLEGHIDLLPETASIIVKKDFHGALSYFPEITVSNTDGFLDGKYTGWCTESDIIMQYNRDLEAYIYSSLEDLSGKEVMKYPENINKVNWILNQVFVGKESQSGGKFIFGDVQYAIWDLISVLPPVVSSPHDEDRVREIVNLAEAHENYIPESGGFFGIIFKIENAQNALIGYPVPDYLEADAWGMGEYFNKKETTAMHFIYKFSK